MGNWKDGIKSNFTIKKNSDGKDDWYDLKNKISLKEEIESTLKGLDLIEEQFTTIDLFIEDNPDILDELFVIAQEYCYMKLAMDMIYEIHDRVSMVYAIAYEDDYENYIPTNSIINRWIELDPENVILVEISNHFNKLADAMNCCMSKNAAEAYKSFKDIVDKAEKKHKKKGDKK